MTGGGLEQNDERHAERLLEENSTNPDYDRRTAISRWKAVASVDV